MAKKQKLKRLIFKAQGGDKNALNQVVERFKPIIKKYARRCRTEDIGSEIVEWIIRATLKYKENIICFYFPVIFSTMGFNLASTCFSINAAIPERTYPTW